MRIGRLIVVPHLVQLDVDLTAFERRHGEALNANQLFESDSDLVRAATDAFDSVFDNRASAPTR